RNGPPFPSCHGLDRVERDETPVRARAVADRPVQCPPAERVSSVLNHDSRPIDEAREIDCETAIMDRNEAISRWNSFRHEVECLWVDIDELNSTPGEACTVRARDEGQGRGNDTVAGAQI